MDSTCRQVRVEEIMGENISEDKPVSNKARSIGEISQTFFEITRQLHEEFEISKGVLILRQQQPPKLAAVSTWSNGLEREGLTVNLPCDSSLFDQVAQDGHVYTENFCGSFSGNFFERKLLLDDDSRSFVVQPLKSHGEVVGLIGYSSEKPTAFALFEEGTLERIAEQLGTMIAVDRQGP